MAADLHHSLGPSPSAKPVCCACVTAHDHAILVPVSSTNKTTFLCASCAASIWAAAAGEHLRRVCEHLLNADPFAVLNRPGSLQ